jgi:hypothetical protein
MKGMLISVIIVAFGVSVIGSCSVDASEPTLIGKWKSVVVEGKQVSDEFSYWEFFEDGTLEVVKWDEGRIEQSMTAKWRQSARNDSAFLVVEVSGRQMEMPIFLYDDSLITVDPSRLDRPYKGRATWRRVESSSSEAPKNEPSETSNPTDEQIKTAVHKALTRKVPGPLVRYATGGEKAQISDLRINAKGKPQVERNVTYWPVKMFAKGTCVVLFGDKKSFEGEIEYFVFQDPYGEWKAEYRGL